MESILRAAFIYTFILLIFRIVGRRSLGEITTFDFVLLLIIGDSAQQGLLGDDYSLTNAVIVVLTLFLMDIGLSALKQKSPKIEQFLEDSPLILIDNGHMLKKRMDKEHIGESEILCAARKTQGLERLDQIKYAILERDGVISIVPQPQPSYND